MKYVIVILVIVIIAQFALSMKKRNSEKDEKDDNFYPYHSKMLLTKNEYSFFQEIEKYNR